MTTRLRRGVTAAAALAALALSPAAAYADDVADDQGFCKKQGSSRCAGQSECSTAKRTRLPGGFEKRC
jgi:hypothetical protein